MIMLQAIASSHGVEPVRNGTALAITQATIRAQVYSAMLRTSSAVLKAAAIENPRVIAELTAVINAQKRNGMFIEHRLLPARTLCVLIVDFVYQCSPKPPWFRSRSAVWTISYKTKAHAALGGRVAEIERSRGMRCWFARNGVGALCLTLAKGEILPAG